MKINDLLSSNLHQSIFSSVLMLLLQQKSTVEQQNDCLNCRILNHKRDIIQSERKKEIEIGQSQHQKHNKSLSDLRKS